VAQNLRQLFNYAGFIGAINNDAQFIVNAGYSFSGAGNFWAGLIENVFIENTQIEVLNQLIYGNNLWEADRGQLYDVASNTDQLVVNSSYALQSLQNIDQNIFLLAQRDFAPDVVIDLSALRTPLDSINNNVAVIMGAVAGGSDIGLGQVVDALGEENLTALAFLENFDAHMRVLESQLSQVAAAGAGDDLSKAVLEVGTYTAKQQDTQNLLTNAYSAADLDAQQKLADNTTLAAALQLIAASLGSQTTQPDADEYSDWVTNSGAFDLLKSVGNPVKLLRNLAQTFAPDVGTVLGAEILASGGAEGKVTTAVTDNTLWAMGRGADYVIKLAKKVLDTTEKMSIEMTPKLQEFWGPQFEKLLNEARDAMMALKETGPKDGFTNAKILLSKAAINGMRAHHTASAMEMIPYAKEIGAHTVTAFMAQMAGFSQIANNVWGAAIQQAVGRPAGYELNAITRSRIPDVGMLEQMVFEREMTEAEQAVLLAYHGFNDDYIARIQRIQYREPNLRQLSSLAADASMTEAQVSNWLQEGGFHPRDVELLTPIVMQQSMRAERGTLQTEVMANLRAGLLTEEDADIYFDRLNLQPAAREMLFTSARLGLRRNSIEDNINTYKQQYQDGLIDDSDFVLGLQAQGITEARVAVEHSAVTSKRFAKVAATEEAESKGEIRKQQGLLVSAMREAFQHGFIDANQFEQALVHGGISDGTARATVELERVKLEGRALTVRSAEAARLLQKEITLREQTFVEMFRKKLINYLQLGQFLLGSGIPGAVVAAIVERELARARPTVEDLFKSPAALKAKELFTLAKATLQVQFAKSAIDANTYLQQLVAIGVDQDVAAATVALEVARRGGEKQPPAPATATSKSLTELRAKVEDALSRSAQTDQTTAALEDVLSRLGLVEEVIDALVAQANEQQEAAAAAQQAEI